MKEKQLANKLAKKFRTRDPFEMIKGMNVIVVLADLVDVRGFYQFFQRNNIIYIVQNLLIKCGYAPMNSDICSCIKGKM